MTNGKFVAYYRVSTTAQGMSGLGLAAQKEAVTLFLNGGHWEVVGEFLEVESGKGKDALLKRPQLKAAMESCRRSGAKLLIAKLDRLARNVHFITGLMEEAKAGKKAIRFVACDMPDANDLTIHLMAAFAEHEAARISERTKAALAMAKQRGKILGREGSNNLKPNIEERKAKADAFADKFRSLIEGFSAQGLTQRQMVGKMNELEIKTARSGNWSLVQLQRLIRRLHKISV
jgi:DNA invertase Pin-like site-specific DNA recombinase